MKTFQLKTAYLLGPFDNVTSKIYSLFATLIVFEVAFDVQKFSATFPYASHLASRIQVPNAC